VEVLKAILFTAAVFIPLERIFALRNQKIFRSHWINDIVFWIANTFIIGFILTILVAFVIFAGRHWLFGLQSAVSSQPAWLQFMEIVLIADLGFYLAHRAMHAVPCLWRLHAIHHSIEELDWLAGFRAHPLDQSLVKCAGALPVFLLGFSGNAIGAYFLLYAWQSVFLHSNVKIRFGPGLRWLLASPEFHHWHHSKDCALRDKNFAGQLPFLDAIFGTAYMPKELRPTSFGVVEPMRQHYLLQLAMPFRPTSPSFSGLVRQATPREDADLGDATRSVENCASGGIEPEKVVAGAAIGAQRCGDAAAFDRVVTKAPLALE
jgi:sterol desaturase/sphingolipid hydroxylase (fatty acid hydroxylase superfamily)